MMTRLHLKIIGMVQGVVFRLNAQEKAQSLGLTGWVRNTMDEGVEITAEGEKEKLEELLAWCRKGPRWAKVDGVREEWSEARGEFQGFEIKYNI